MEPTIEARCTICGKTYLRHAHVPASRAKTCVPASHRCKKGVCKKNGCCLYLRRRAYHAQVAMGQLERDKYLTQEELTAVFKHLPKLEEMYRLGIRFIAGTGIRVGELVWITAADLVLESDPPYIMVPTLKRVGRPKRRVDLEEGLAASLKALVRDEELEPHHKLFDASKASFQRAWKRLQIAAKSTPIRGIHALRHSHFTRLAELKVPAEYAQKRAGWSSMAMYQVYVHLTETTRQEIAPKLPKF
jgi:integrase